MILESSIGDATLTARARFFSLAPYTAAAPGSSRPSRRVDDRVREDVGLEGRAHLQRRRAADQDDEDPGRLDPFQCRGSTLKVRLPRFASANWIHAAARTP
jgi:hypothetical protein